MQAGYRINHERDFNLDDSENPTFIIVYNFSGFNDIDLVSTNNKNHMKVPQTVGRWNIKYKKDERK